MKLLLSIAIAAVAWTASAQGTFQAILSYSNEIPALVFGTAGGTFQTPGFITVTELGCFNYLFAQNQGPIQVGLWGPDGSLLASNTITSSSALLDQTRYESITPVPLDPYVAYHLGAFSPNGSISLNIASPTLDGGVATSAEIQLLTSAASTNGVFMSPPGIPGTGGAFYLGPNFQFQDRVPEPFTLPLLLFGLAGLLLAARHKSGP